MPLAAAKGRGLRLWQSAHRAVNVRWARHKPDALAWVIAIALAVVVGVFVARL